VPAALPAGTGHAPEPVVTVGTKRGATVQFTVPVGVMLGVALLGITGPSYWRDEASTLSAARRSLPDLWQMLHHTDAVHGVYYMIIWADIRVTGTGELGTRWPSAVAMAIAAGMVSIIGRRLVSPRAGLIAGLTFAALPVTTRYGQETRSYPLVMAMATVASYLLLKAYCEASGAPPKWRWAACYSLALTAAAWLNLMSLLIIPAHAITLLLAQRRAIKGQPRDACAQALFRRRMTRWLAAVAGAIVLVSPLLDEAWSQRTGTSDFLGRDGWPLVGGVPWHLTGAWPVLLAAVPLLLLGTGLGGPARAALAGLALPWLLVPPAVLLAAGVFTPAFNHRYVLFCVPALALLMGSGLDVLATKVPALAGSLRSAGPGAGGRDDGGQARWREPATIVAGLVIIALLGLSQQFAYRAPGGHGDDIRQAARIVADNEHPGDAVLYTHPWWRQFGAAYPYGFDRLRDISLAESPVTADNLDGTDLSLPRTRDNLRAVTRVWVVEAFTHPGYFYVSLLKGGGWTLRHKWSITDIRLMLYQRTPHRS
jgi:mannosyltransferase